MHSPLGRGKERNQESIYLDVSRERLAAMSPSELTDAMEQALESMTEETYDPDIISQYLDALDQKSPMPEHLDLEHAYADFQKRIQSMCTLGAEKVEKVPVKRFKGFRRTLRIGLVATLLLASLFGCMIVAQASGVDVFAVIAHWTENAFAFGELPSDNAAYESSETVAHIGPTSGETEVPEEYKELHMALEERGLPLYIPQIPKEFTVEETVLYIAPDTGNITFNICYTKDVDYIMFLIIQNDGGSKTVYEKDTSKVDIFEYNDIIHYIFSNNDSNVATWMIEGMEYSITTNSKSVSLKELIQSIYEE